MGKNFIMLKNNIVRNKNGASLLIKANNSKVVNVLCALDQMINRLDWCCFSIEKLCIACNVKPTKGKDRNGKPRTIEQIRNILILLQQEGYIDNLNVDLSKVKADTFIECTYNNKIEKDGFFKLDVDIFLKLVELKNIDALNFYCYIKSIIGENNYYCFPKEEDISKDLNICKDNIKKTRELLKVNNLIDFGNIGNIIKNGKVQATNMVYVLESKNLLSALDISKAYYVNQQGASIVGKRTDKKVKQLNMLKSTAKRELNKGKEISQNVLDNINKLEKQLNEQGTKITRKEALEKIDEILKDSKLTAGDIATDLQVSVYTAEGCEEILNQIQDKEYIKELEKEYGEIEEKLTGNSDVVKHDNRNRRSFYDDDTWGTEEPNMYGEWEEPKTKIKNDKDYQEFLKSLNPSNDNDDSWINDL